MVLLAVYMQTLNGVGGGGNRLYICTSRVYLITLCMYIHCSKKKCKEERRERKRSQQKLVLTVGACQRVWADIRPRVASFEMDVDLSTS